MEPRSVIQVTGKGLSLLSMPQVYHIHGQMEMGLALLKAFFVGNLETGMKIDCLYQILQSYLKSHLLFGSLCRLGKKPPNTRRNPIRDKTDARVNLLDSRDISITAHLTFNHTFTDLKVLCRSVYTEVLT